jgi:hypothetical protein
MRRILETNYKKPKPIYTSLSTDTGPFYDPYDIHIHKWIVGVIKNPQKYREPNYDFSPETEDTYKERMYCSICHELNIDVLSTCFKPSVDNVKKCDRSNLKYIGGLKTSGHSIGGSRRGIKYCTKYTNDDEPMSLKLIEKPEFIRHESHESQNISKTNLFMRPEEDYDEVVMIRNSVSGNEISRKTE